jgi:hypothetical protein
VCSGNPQQGIPSTPVTIPTRPRVEWGRNSQHPEARTRGWIYGRRHLGELMNVTPTELHYLHISDNKTFEGNHAIWRTCHYRPREQDVTNTSKTKKLMCKRHLMLHSYRKSKAFFSPEGFPRFARFRRVPSVCPSVRIEVLGSYGTDFHEI